MGNVTPRISQADLRLNIDQFAHFLADLLVEIEQKVPALLEEGTDVVLIVVEKRRLTVGALQGIPVQMPPVAMIADPYFVYS